MEEIDVVVPSAGLGLRMGLSMPKQFALLGGIPLIVHPLRTFQNIEWIGQLIVVHGQGQAAHVTDILNRFSIQNCVLVEGGPTRQESVRLGLSRVRTPRVIIHNAAVALVEQSAIELVASVNGDCITTATRLEVNIVCGDDFAEKALPKERLSVINSPQCFVTSVLKNCHQRATEAQMEFASETELMLHYNHSVRLVRGTPRNFKITTPIDLMVAEAMLAQVRLSGLAGPNSHAAV
jgi:2-C-methyl-D-erythritol 4-phosphate cytidylyltransferase